MTTLNDLKQWDEVGVITPQGILGPTRVRGITATMIVLGYDRKAGIESGDWKFNRKTGIAKTGMNYRVVPWSKEMEEEQQRAKELKAWWIRMRQDYQVPLDAIAAMRAAYEAWEKETDR